MGMDWTRVSVDVVIVEMMDRSDRDDHPVDVYLQKLGFQRYGYACQDMVYTSLTFKKNAELMKICME